MLLELDGVSASYRGLKALQGVSLKVAAGEIVAVVGANGAGKSTLLRAIAGQVATEGTVTFDGAALVGLKPHLITRQGVGLVPEGKRLFPRLSVEDNLRLGAYAKRGDPKRFAPLELVFTLFPRLQERLPQRAETLSGGEQQMLAIGRALMTQPRLLMLDEPSQGIAPKLVDDILAAVGRIRDLGHHRAAGGTTPGGGFGIGRPRLCATNGAHRARRSCRGYRGRRGRAKGVSGHVGERPSGRSHRVAQRRPARARPGRRPALLHRGLGPDRSGRRRVSSNRCRPSRAGAARGAARAGVGHVPGGQPRGRRSRRPRLRRRRRPHPRRPRPRRLARRRLWGGTRRPMGPHHAPGSRR